MADNQQTNSGTTRLVRTGTLALTVLTPVINALASRLAERLEQSGKHPATLVEVDVQEQSDAKQSLSDALLERREALIQELEDLVERGTHLSQSLIARSSEVTHDLAERGSDASQDLLKRGSEASQDLLKRSEEIRNELRKRGKKLNKDLNKRSQKVAKDLSKRSEKLTKELSKRSRQATNNLSERSGTFWIIVGFAVGLAATGAIAYLLIRQRVQKQQQLEEDHSFPLSQNGYLNTNTIPYPIRNTTPASTELSSKQPTQPSLTEENVPAVAIADQENNFPAAQTAPANATFIGVVSTKRYYPVSTPIDQLSSAATGNNAVIYFTTEEEAQTQGYSSGN